MSDKYYYVTNIIICIKMKMFNIKSTKNVRFVFNFQMILSYKEFTELRVNKKGKFAGRMIYQKYLFL